MAASGWPLRSLTYLAAPCIDRRQRSVNASRRMEHASSDRL